MRGRIFVVAAICAASALFAALTEAHAQSLSVVAATAASNCSKIAANSHRNPDSRSLSSAKSSQLQRLCSQVHLPASKVRFWNNKANRWTLYLNNTHFKCGELRKLKKLKGPEALCFRARFEVRHHGQILAKVSRKIERLTAPSLVLGDVGAWKCIHRYERNPAQGWRTRTGNGYYGGLQMDMSFQGSYGPWVLGFIKKVAGRWIADPDRMFRVRGTADRWTPEEQMAVAEFARSHGRGYYPWPNTARYCGLI